MEGIKIVSLGKYVPERVMTNDDWAKLVDTSDEWIVQRTGMKERRFAAEGETTTMLATNAAKAAIDKSGIDPAEIGAIVCATVSADNYSPSTACLVQRNLELRDDMIAFDISAGCSGFIFALETMRGLLASTGAKYGLVVAAERLSSKIDWNDRTTCVLFGDGAGAALVTLDENSEYTSSIGVHGDDQMINIKVPDGHIFMDGQGTYKFAVTSVPKLINGVLEKANVTPDDIDGYYMHQANVRIIESVSNRLNQPMDKFFLNIEKYGNTSAASLALLLCDADEQGVIKRGQRILMAGFGAGKTYGAIVMTW